MVRSFSAAAATALIATFGIAAGCYDSTPALHPTGAVCDGQSEADAAGCDGQVCLVLGDNVQGLPGMCSELCDVDTQCTPHEQCVSNGTESFCLRACLTDDDCFDTFVCRSVAGYSSRFCFVDAL